MLTRNFLTLSRQAGTFPLQSGEGRRAPEPADDKIWFADIRQNFATIPPKLALVPLCLERDRYRPVVQGEAENYNPSFLTSFISVTIPAGRIYGLGSSVSPKALRAFWAYPINCFTISGCSSATLFDSEISDSRL